MVAEAIMLNGKITWAAISGVAGLVAAWFALTQVVVAPLERRIDVARENFRQVMHERDARMDYLQKQIDEIERLVKP